MKVLSLLLILISTSVCSQEVTPTQRLYQTLVFADDMDFENLDLAIERQMAAYRRTGLNGQIRFGTKNYPRTVLRDSLLLFQSLVHKSKKCQKTQAAAFCLDQLNADINAQFAIYVPVTNGKRNPTHFTSYYSPDLNGSRVPTERFKRAIYARPTNPADQNHSRVDIDYHGALAGKGLEIFWVEESFYDLYLLHVQGGGRITVWDSDGNKEIKYLSYNGKNNRSFQMIYHYMLAQGYLQPGSAGIPAQRRFLAENPHKEEEIFSVSPSYVYFRESDEEPVGVHNIPLTEGRSLAIDNRIYRSMGMINFVKTVKASHLDESGSVVKEPFSRFFISQDTGGAIRGNARCDLYFGYGDLAELTAYNMNEQGEQYFLVKKN